MLLTHSHAFIQPNDCLTLLIPKMHPQNAYGDVDGVVVPLPMWWHHL